MLREIARAKINLNLHVGRLVSQKTHKYFGYHPLSSLVLFSDLGDELACQESDATRLDIAGPFSKGLESDQSNLVLKAYHAVAARTEIPNLNFKLTKNLPIASGIGGGSADAAAALRLLKNYAKLDEMVWQEIALALGADVPVCLNSKSCIMTGIGETIERLENMGQLLAVLVNPNQPVSTGEVFRAFDQTNHSEDLSQPGGNLIARMNQSRNDLEAIAARQVPVIRECISALGPHGRMSGSGATCFGIYDTKVLAEEAAHKIKQQYPDWWVVTAMLGDAS